MEARAAQETERKLVDAIEKAASFASINDCDRNKLLADCLLESGIDRRFAKTASCAFNKRLTVLKLSNTGDEHKADSFPLSDSAEVEHLMGGSRQLTKSASACDGEFVMRLRQPSLYESMNKAASCTQENRVNIEDRPNGMELVEKQIDKILAQQTDAFRNLQVKEAGLRRTIDRLGKDVEIMLSKEASWRAQALANTFGERLSALLPESVPMPNGTCIPESNPLFHKTAALMDTIREHDDLVYALNEYAEGLREFSMGVSQFQMKKIADEDDGAGGSVNDLATLYDIAQLGKDKGAINAVSSIAARAAGTAHKSPGDVITTKFVLDDRAMDRLMGWSDMSADPSFAMYPSEQVFAATQKAMDLHPTLERADARELLRAQVGQLLAQNNRAGMSDISALYTTLASAGRAPLSAVQEASIAARALPEVSGKQISESSAKPGGGSDSKNKNSSQTKDKKKDTSKSRNTRGTAGGNIMADAKALGLRAVITPDSTGKASIKFKGADGTLRTTSEVKQLVRDIVE